MDLSRYRDLFISEANEHLKALSSLAVRCDSGIADQDAINEMFRHAHSLKGMAATMQLLPISGLAHALEDLLSRVRSGEIPFNRQVSDLLLAGNDTLEQSVELVARGAEPPLCDDLVARVRNYTPTSSESQQAPAALPQPAKNSPDFSFRTSDQPSTVRIKTSLLDRLVTITGELLTVRHRIENQTAMSGVAGMTEPLHDLSLLLRQLQQEVFQARMLPFSVIAERFPRMTRDLAHKSGKELQFHLIGDTIELDRGVLELISDPLVHLLRNAVDHGLEPPAERVATGKLSTGSITLSVSRLADHILVVISDDGRGMDPGRIRAKALAQGLIDDQQAANLSTEETLLLVCAPGFSTAAAVTDISGRGVGMDVVRNAVQNIGGALTIESEYGKGTRIALKLPVSIAIIQALLVDCGGLTLAIPVGAISSTQEVSPDRLVIRDDRQILLHNGSEIPVGSLARFYRQPPAAQPVNGLLPVLLTDVNGRPVGLLVDHIRGQQELFVRPLSQPLSSLRGISGASLLGDGRTIFVVDVASCVGPTTAT